MHNRTTLMLKLFQRKETNHSIENVGKDSIYFPKYSFAFSLIENYKMLGSFWELSWIFYYYSKFFVTKERYIIDVRQGSKYAYEVFSKKAK